jgi:hypothetical protein
MKISELLEAATAGATSSGAIASVSNPLFSPGRARGKASYIGRPGMSGWKSPPQPKPKRQRPGTNALDITSVGLFGQPLRKKKKQRRKRRKNK